MLIRCRHCRMECRECTEYWMMESWTRERLRDGLSWRLEVSLLLYPTKKCLRYRMEYRRSIEKHCSRFVEVHPSYGAFPQWKSVDENSSRGFTGSFYINRIEYSNTGLWLSNIHAQCMVEKKYFQLANLTMLDLSNNKLRSLPAELGKSRF